MKTEQSPMTNRLQNLKIAFITAQAGCATLVIIMVALLVGAWLGNLLGQRGLCIFGMVVLSVPVSLYVMLWIAMRAIRVYQTAQPLEDENTN